MSYAVDRAAAAVPSDELSGKTVGNSKSVRAAKDDTVVYDIELDGKTYEWRSFLGEGGFSDVHAYVNKADDQDVIALKVMKKDVSADSTEDQLKDFSKAFDDGVNEIAMHEQARAQSENVIDVAGALRFPDGRLCIAVEIAPNGDATDMATAIRDAAGGQSPKITTQQADVLRLTMIQDMAKGLDDMHAAGMTHYDFKSPNCLIGADGTVKIADFGLTLGNRKAGDAIHVTEAQPIGNLFFKAPEMEVQENEDYKIRSEKKSDDVSEANKRGMREGLKNLLPGTGEEYIDSLTSSILKEGKENGDLTKRDGLLLTAKVDSWGLGASALDMFTEQLPFGYETGWQQGAELRLYHDIGVAQGSDAVATVTNGQAQIAGGPVRDLLNGLLAPTADQRLSPSDVLAHDAMKTKGVGSQAAKDLMVALKSGDAEEISAARDALRHEIGTDAPDTDADTDTDSDAG